MPDTASLERILRRVEAARADAIDLAQALIRIPTVNPPGDAYEPCCRLLADRLAARGFDVALLRAEGALADSARYPRTNMVARIAGGRPGPTVHFNSHIDVVAPGQGWTVDPFAATVRDGRIYGRGSCDMKGGLAASIVAVEAILAETRDFPGAIEISGTVDEETGGYAGVAWLAERGYFSPPRVDHVIIPEPLHKDCVCLGHRGVWWAEIETKGRIAHGSMPFLGVSAIRHMGAVLERMEHELYPLLAARRTEMPVIPEGARASTLNVNSIHGGLDEGHDGLPSPLVADSCRIVIDRRFLIEETCDGVRAEMVDLLEAVKHERRDFDYALRDLWSVDPVMTDPEAPVARALSAGIERVLGRPARHIASPGTYDQKHVVRIGNLKDCVAYGPGILDLAHQPDEYVGIDDMMQSAQVMAAACWSLLHGG